MPTRGAVRHAVFDHEAYRQLGHPTRVMTAGQGSIRQIDVKILPTSRTRVRRVGHHEIDRTASAQIAQIMERALAGFVARGQMPASGTGGMVVVPVVRYQDRCGEVLDVNNALGGVWYVFTRSVHAFLS